MDSVVERHDIRRADPLEMRHAGHHGNLRELNYAENFPNFDGHALGYVVEFVNHGVPLVSRPEIRRASSHQGYTASCHRVNIHNHGLTNA